MEKSEKRCLNIDWLEVYCMESPLRYPCNAEYYRSRGYFVQERDYGTRQYREMFVILDKDERPFIEVRRNPVAGDDRNKGMFSAFSCHIRLSNRYCYADNCVTLLTDFLLEHEISVQRLFRLDLCMDFERFDHGDDPHDILVRYLKGRYTKINQSNVSAYGRDRWEAREWNSISWGAPTSMVSTKFYCKSLELQEAKDKPYIRYAWMCAGLIDDFTNLTKRKADGQIYKPVIWRVEFSIRSSAKGWVMVEDCNGKKSKQVAVEHSLATYATKDSQLKAFANLAHHYFHFKHYEEGVRKDRCKDKVLFDFANHNVYTLDRLLTDKPADSTLSALERRLCNFKIVHPEYAQTCATLIEAIAKLKVRDSLPNYYDRNEAKLLQLLISRRIKGSTEDFSTTLTEITQLMKLGDEIF